MTSTDGFIDEQGRILIPKPMRGNLGLEKGTRVELRIVGDGLMIRAIDAAIADVRAELNLAVPGDGA